MQITKIETPAGTRWNVSFYHPAKRGNIRKRFKTEQEAREFGKRASKSSVRVIPPRIASAGPAILADIDEALRLVGRSSATLTEAALYYLEHVKGRRAMRRLPDTETLVDSFVEARDARETTKASYRRALLALQARLKVALASATREDLETVMQDESLAAESRNNYLRHARVFYDWLVDRDYIGISPSQKVKQVRVERRDVSFLSADEAERLMAAVKRECPEFTAAFAIGLFAGVRPAAIAKLEPGDILLDEKLIRVGWQEDKTGQKYYAEMSPNLVRWLECNSEGQSFEISRFAREKACSAAGVKWSQDVLRHTFASHHLAMHGDLSRTVHALNHRNSDMLYRHYRAAVKPSDGEKFFAIMP